MKYSRCLLVVLLSVALAGCLQHRTDTAGSRSERSVLTLAEMNRQPFDNAYEVVVALRNTWLHDRGPSTIGNDARVAVVVYLDNVKLGDQESLRSVPMRVVGSMKHLDGVEAQARFGIGHAAGAILVESVK
ncbi:MAG: hypothetical protein JWM95_5492 [Gemmatimonadetes bacterium]|nr:hypothetical protein [Gemmatimonadota bacterium]